MHRLTKTKLFIDGGDPEETELATKMLLDAGYAGLDGQTTNPSLVAKNPDIAARMEAGDKLTEDELLQKYKDIVIDIEEDAAGDISIEVYADKDTTAEAMVAQAREFNGWIESAVIKLPIIESGLEAASVLKDEMKLNMTLCFTQEQAAAVYAAAKGAKHTVYISPFIGRLDDREENGMDLVKNISQMYGEGSHVEVLTASVRHVEHILGALSVGTEALTLPFEKAFKPWAEGGFKLPGDEYEYKFDGSGIAYEEISLDKDWREYNIQNELTGAGLDKFASDWNSLLLK